MIAYFIFLFAAVVMFFGANVAERAHRPGGPRPFGLIFLLAVLLAAFSGWTIDTFNRLEEPVLNVSGGIRECAGRRDDAGHEPQR